MKTLRESKSLYSRGATGLPCLRPAALRRRRIGANSGDAAQKNTELLAAIARLSELGPLLPPDETACACLRAFGHALLQEVVWRHKIQRSFGIEHQTGVLCFQALMEVGFTPRIVNCAMRWWRSRAAL